MIQNVSFALLWLGFVVYAFAFAPPAGPDTLETIVQLSSGQWSTLNPAVVALFNLMGIWPMIYACLALIDGTNQRIPAWPFVTLSFALGAFALLPYWALRSPNPIPFKSALTGKKDRLLALVDSPWTGRAIALGSVVLLSYGLLNGDWGDFAQQWQTSQFIHVMSLDFCMLSAIAAPLVKDDMAKRGIDNPALFWAAVLIPMVGVSLYLAVRTPLEEDDSEVNAIAGANP